MLKNNALALTKRQQAEIERLQTEKDNLIRIYKECMTEAIKEFAERLSLDIQRHLMPNVDDDGTVTVENAERYFLGRIKELTEGSDGE